MRLFVVFALLSLSSCNKVEKAGKDVKEATKDIKQTGEKVGNSVDSAAAKIRDGLKELGKIDPLALRTLILTNTQLRNSLDSAKIQLAQFGNPSGIITTRNRLLRLQIRNWSGSFEVNSYLDSPTRVFWAGKLVDDRSFMLPIDYDDLFLKLPSISRAQEKVYGQLGLPKGFPAEKVASQILPDIRNDFTTILKAKIEGQFRESIRTQRVLPVLSDNYIDLNSSLLTPGPHNLVVTVTPMSLNAQGRWFIEFELVSINTKGEISERIQSFTFSDLKKFKLGEALPNYNSFLFVSLDNQGVAND